IPGTVESIGMLAFVECSSLESIVIPEGVESIDEGAFFLCTSLKEVYIPDSMRYIHLDAFVDCDELKIYAKYEPSYYGYEANGYELPENITWIVK
ncbi:MAG: leucine-rich repeat domain-containing protein, partial [Clostridia bacterium]|nr:leucine-rich repeat domain-containing protein [Clostridia bacterium]